MFDIKGKIIFDPINVTKKHHSQSEWKKTAIVKFDCELYAYYSWFIEKRYSIKLNKPLRGTHVTLLNEIIDDNIYLDAKKIFHEKEVTITYDPTYIRTNEKGHWWIKVYSSDIENIRTSIGLGPNPFYGLHLTIGNATHLNLEQSLYIKKLIDTNIVS
jgi:hypothetical protein